MSTATGADVIVVGAGVVGAATAAAIAARGASVILIEKECAAAREGSGRAQGSLRVQGRHGSEFPLAQEALRLWVEAAEHSDFELVRSGNLYFRTQEDELPVLQRLVGEAHRAGLSDVQLLDPDQVREMIPAATGPFLGAMWSPVDAHCQPEKGTAHFIRTAERHGARIIYGTKVTRLQETAGRITGVDTADGPLHADAAVVAGGVWTPHLAQTVGVNLPIMPVIMSELETEPVGPLFEPTIRAFGFGARQRPNGRVVVSAGLNARVGHGVSLTDFNGLRYWLPRAMAFRKNIRLQFDLRAITRQIRALSTLSPRLVPDRSPEPHVDRTLVDSSLDRLARVFPGLSGAQAQRYWAGLVDLTPDGLPIIDSTAGPQGLTVITGLCGHGFTLGPVLGEIGADFALDGATSRGVGEFAAARFAEGKAALPEMTI